MGRQMGAAIFRGPYSLGDEIATLKEQIGPQDKVWILSFREPVMHLASSRASAAPCSLLELLLMDDFRSMIETLRSHPADAVWIDCDLAPTQGVAMIIELLAKEYRPVAATSRGRLYRRTEWLNENHPAEMAETLHYCLPEKALKLRCERQYPMKSHAAAETRKWHFYGERLSHRRGLIAGVPAFSQMAPATQARRCSRSQQTGAALLAS